eukprot:3184249-Pleurochrysis_carterae.AAC.8
MHAHPPARPSTRTHACTHACTLARTHARTRTHTYNTGAYTHFAECNTVSYGRNTNCGTVKHAYKSGNSVNSTVHGHRVRLGPIVTFQKGLRLAEVTRLRRASWPHTGRCHCAMHGYIWPRLPPRIAELDAHASGQLLGGDAQGSEGGVEAPERAVHAAQRHLAVGSHEERSYAAGGRRGALWRRRVGKRPQMRARHCDVIVRRISGWREHWLRILRRHFRECVRVSDELNIWQLDKRDHFCKHAQHLAVCGRGHRAAAQLAARRLPLVVQASRSRELAIEPREQRPSHARGVARRVEAPAGLLAVRGADVIARRDGRVGHASQRARSGAALGSSRVGGMAAEHAAVLAHGARLSNAVPGAEADVAAVDHAHELAPDGAVWRLKIEEASRGVGALAHRRLELAADAYAEEDAAAAAEAEGEGPRRRRAARRVEAKALGVDLRRLQLRAFPRLGSCPLAAPLRRVAVATHEAARTAIEVAAAKLIL